MTQGSSTKRGAWPMAGRTVSNSARVEKRRLVVLRQGWQPKFEKEGYRFTPVWNSGEKLVLKQQLQLLRFEKVSPGNP